MKIKHLFLGAILFTFLSLHMNAATITVTNTNDSSAGSLRQAIVDTTPGSTINFDPIVFATSKTITLTSGELVIDKDLTIQGPGRSLLSISGNHSSRVFLINTGVTATLDGITIRNGNALGSAGAGIYNTGGTLTIINSFISDNRANDGGGIVSWGMLTVINSTISDNRAGYSGGILSSGTLTVINSAISVNTATSGFGGGINYGGTLTMSNSTISGNFGSGIEKTGTYGDCCTSISNSTISGNSGAGIFNRGGSLVINNSTISDNMGGGIYNAAYCDTNCYDGLVSITHSTISRNGVGIFSNSGEGPALEELRNTIVAGNTNSDISGTIETARHNLIGDAASSGGIQHGVNGNIVGVNPLLGPLQNSGGPTMTRALRLGSPAINAGDNCVLTANGCGNGNPALPTDQRGRPRNGTVDIGAFERQPEEIPSTAPFDFDGDGRSDVSVFRPSDRVWYLDRSTGGFRAVQFGLSTDKIVPADYDGDGKTDVGIFRDDTWWWINSSNSTVGAVQFGLAGDIPVPADYTGDGRDELAVYRNGEWRSLDLSTGNSAYFGNLGVATDKPVPADYDGDGRTDIAIYRDGTWWRINSGTGYVEALQFGLASDRPVAGDFDGDSRADLAVYRDGTWYLLQSRDGFAAFPFGIASDIPAPADYDGDGKADAAVFRSGTWYILNSTGGVTAQQFGLANDKPIQAAYEQ